MTKIVEISEFGGPSVLKITNKNLDKLKPNEVLVQNKSIGLNFMILIIVLDFILFLFPQVLD